MVAKISFNFEIALHAAYDAIAAFVLHNILDMDNETEFQVLTHI
jgi:hypothetical protein